MLLYKGLKMKNKFLLAISILVLSGQFAFAKDSAEPVIGFFNIDKIFNATEEGKEANTKLKKSYTEFQETLNKDNEKIEKLKEQYQKQVSVLNEKARMEKQMEIAQLMEGLNRKSMELDQKFRNLQKDLKTPILDKIQKIARDVSEKSDVSMTVERSYVPIIYSKNSKVLDESIIDIYNKSFPLKK
jgi:outer membrane protein